MSILTLNSPKYTLHLMIRRKGKGLKTNKKTKQRKVLSSVIPASQSQIAEIEAYINQNLNFKQRDCIQIIQIQIPLMSKVNMKQYFEIRKSNENMLLTQLTFPLRNWQCKGL